MEKGTKVYINGQGHITKLTATPIYGKTLKIFFRIECRMKICMQHQELKLYEGYTNTDPGLTPNSRPNLVAYAFDWGICYKKSHLIEKKLAVNEKE